MRQYFLDLLNNLDKLTGLKQMDKLMSLPNHKEEINTLLDILCRVSQQFDYIPEKDQQAIIDAAIISDESLTSLNAKVVYKWLNAQRDRYMFVKSNPGTVDENYKPLEGEARQEKLREWLASLSKLENNVSTKSHVKILEESLPAKVNTNYQPLTAEEVLRKELHIQYIKENYDPRTAKKLETWVEEEAWLSKVLATKKD